MAKILFVDDNELTLKLMETSAKLLGYEIVSCSSAKDALEIVEQISPKLIFVDYGLQDLDGPTLIRKLRSIMIREDTKIVMVSAGFSKNDAHQAKLAGADQFLEKPLSLEKLSDLFNESFNGHH